MGRTTCVAIAVLVFAAGALATDYELKYDWGTTNAGFGGPHDIYYGHDFDLTNYNPRFVKNIRVYSSGLVFNKQWDGFNIALFDFSNGYPGEMLWGPKFVVGSGMEGPYGQHWCDFTVAYTLPTGKTKIIAAVQQYWNGENFDPLYIDNGPYLGHQWWRTSPTQWSEYYNDGHNLLIRIVVSTNVGVAPASLGRVKAVFN